MNADTGEFIHNEDLEPNWVFLAKLWLFLTTKNPIISSPELPVVMKWYLRFICLINEIFGRKMMKKQMKMKKKIK